MKGKPNVVLITVDSLRADFVGYQNPEEKNTPFLDSFAKKSSIFTNAISPANPTFFTFCSLMTGTLPFAFGNYLGIPDNYNIKTIAEVLKDNEYNTSAFLADSPSLYSEYGYSEGFDMYDDGYEDTSNKLDLRFGETLWKIRQAIPDKILSVFEPLRSIIVNSFMVKKNLVSGRKLNKKIKKYFVKKNQEPFFLWLHYMDTHLPYGNGLGPPFFKNKSFMERFIKKVIFYKELSTSVRKMKLKNASVVEIYKEAYRTSVKYLDRCLKEIIDFLQGKYPNTIFIIASDHGEAFMEHGLFAHEAMSLHNELIKVPLIIHVPGRKAKKIVRTASLVSIAKTIASLVGISEPSFQGNDLLKDKEYFSVNNVSRVLYKCRSPHVRLGILDNKTEIKGNYTELWSFTTPEEKYIREVGGNIEEFYSINTDPFEEKNLIRKKQINSSKIIGQLDKIIKET